MGVKGPVREQADRWVENYSELPPSLEPRLRRYLTDEGQRSLRIVLGLLGALTFVALLLVGADGPSDPTLAPPAIAGFAPEAFSFRAATNPGCAAVANPERLSRGLIGLTDLGGFPAVALRYPTDQTQPTTNRGVSFRVSLAWFDVAGAYLGHADLLPCPDQDGCPPATPPAPYRVVMVSTRGDLEPLGAGPGSVLSLGGACH